MRINIGSLDLKDETANWLKVMAELEGVSVRNFLADFLNKSIDKRRYKWLKDLEIAAAAREMSVTELWTYILENGAMPEATNNAAAIEKFIEQIKNGEGYEDKEG
ncbi:hypothetical protein IFO70_36630 [Phormidium tenue FACHB-886]|nr:hypothetical protein [Phormidium tenue FACHB-886]